MALRATHSHFIKRNDYMTHINWDNAKIYTMPEWMLDDELIEMLEAERLAIAEWVATV